MASPNILKLKVDSSEYDSKIKRASQGLLHLGDSLKKAGKSFLDADKDQIAFVRELGKMETVSKTATGSVSEMSKAFTDLRMQYKQMTDEEKKGEYGRALNQSLEELKGKLQDTKQQLAEVKREMDGAFDNVKMPEGAFGDFKDMMSVFGGNVMTKAAELGTQALSALGQEIVETAKKSVQLSIESEGIRMAFERLNRPGLLDNLREATHGTVNDIELMKAAVKFDDFGLSLDQLGTMLAFAQQKAKDTGQSIDYMVDSIVTGLGRKSVMILDNLGLSAAEIKERMKETGDMTVAVGDMIREQMSNAGDYVETASDRAAKATADYENQLVELGDQIRETFGIGSMEEFNMYLKTELVKTISFTIDWFNDAKIAINNAWNAYTELTAPIDAVYNKVEEIANSNAITRWMLKIESLVNPLLHVYTLVKSIGNELGLGGGGGGLGNAFQRASQINSNRQHEGTFTVVRDGSGKVLSATSNGKDVTAQYIKNNPSVGATGGGGGKKGGGGRGGGSKGETDQEKAAKMVANAERTYAETMQKEALRLESGIDDELAAKKKELSAQERLFDAYNDAYATYKDPKYKDEISKTADKIKALGVEIKGMEDAVKAAKVKVEMAQGLSGFNAQTMNAWMQGRQSDLSKAEYGTAEYSKIQSNIADMTTIKTLLEQAMQAGMDAADLNLEPLWEKVFDFENVPDDVWQNLVDQINEKLKELDIKPIEIDFRTGQVKKQAKEMKTDWQAAASAIQSVGTAMSQIEDPAAKVIGTIAQAIATIAQGFAIATSKEANKGVWNWIAAIAAGTATMLSTIATIKSVTKGGYAEGGIIPGNNMSGDNVPMSMYGINSGELILNRAQAGIIAHELEGGGVQNLRLSATITGEQIRLALNNNGKRTGRGEYVTSNFMR